MPGKPRRSLFIDVELLKVMTVPLLFSVFDRTTGNAVVTMIPLRCAVLGRTKVTHTLGQSYDPNHMFLFSKEPKTNSMGHISLIVCF